MMKLNGDIKIGAVLLWCIVALSLAGMVWIPYEYNAMEASARFLPPGPAHLLGTDNFGRDVFSRIMAGGKYTLLVAVCTVAGSAAIGAVLGLVTGYAGGVWDEAVMRLMDALNAFPGILLALVMVSLLDNGEGTLILALVALFIPSFTRLMRNGMLEYKSRDFVKAVELLGLPRRRIIFLHIMPSLAPSFLSAVALGLSNAVLAEAALSYLGLGIQPPLPSWGRMLSESQNFLFNAPWCALAPGLMITLTVLAFHALGEGIRRRYCS
ncbi:MAG: ABC transporter permease [Treponema sp.]|jgi:peptide/nickel transport system permease protein|nr:ABC transporter permease [Treponema sp.]